MEKECIVWRVDRISLSKFLLLCGSGEEERVRKE